MLIGPFMRATFHVTYLVFPRLKCRFSQSRDRFSHDAKDPFDPSSVASSYRELERLRLRNNTTFCTRNLGFRAMEIRP